MRPPGLADKRFESLYLFAACRPGTDQAFALAPPEATATTMNLFLAGFAEQLEPDAHAVLILPGPGGLAWLAAPRRAGRGTSRCHAAAAACLLARAEPGRAGVALPP